MLLNVGIFNDVINFIHNYYRVLVCAVKYSQMNGNVWSWSHSKHRYTHKKVIIFRSGQKVIEEPVNNNNNKSILNTANISNIIWKKEQPKMTKTERSRKEFVVWMLSTKWMNGEKCWNWPDSCANFAAHFILSIVIQMAILM